MKARKTKSVVICVLLTLLLLVVLYNITASSSALMKRHIAKKYGIKAQEIDVTHFEWNRFDMDLGLDSSGTVNYRCRKWECKYKERIFHVENYAFQYADDYQLEDIFKWCTDYLQENYDKDIVGVNVSSYIIYNSFDDKHGPNLPWKKDYVFTKSDAKDLLDTQRTIDNNRYLSQLKIYYKTNNLSDYLSEKNGRTYADDRYTEFSNKKSELLEDFGKVKISIVNKLDYAISEKVNSGSGQPMYYQYGVKYIKNNEINMYGKIIEINNTETQN